ncbi:fumarylacetoacetate hydrolase family protein [Legionella worsleiensis]|uniref:Homoprotocatechuate catabolism bifunctional isomerase/decarboxylase n=1 Tax=Legionella worsleiensis TaxID=45076 RepID=A0A0W1AJI1_9GAMM|nr:fumarylacetoacetate hydrolase family protein [Legionella worsleiensis]KTD81509.1 Homoprotocatechuate catabolism bifunctional isomerase/decarboxylase [Legionella worsleiensis]STY32068.1 2-keto-4-pentenoate hydratase/2-oxohepta-3-ene-1,7-dioic acid hydratase (catechol pathway) [Legionella worsleiensis]
MSIDKIVCVGKNYLDHARELGDAIPEQPVLFLKPSSVLNQAPAWGDHLHLDLPNADNAVQPECEIVLRVAHDGYKMSYEEARNAISEVTLGLDMTLRTRQSELKKQGHPWTTAKVFPDAAVLGPWIPYHQFQEYLNVEFQLFINGTLKQCAKGSDMMMCPVDLLVYISQFFPLKSGDIIYTGTPAGVTSISKHTSAELRWDSYSFKVTWH